MRSPQPFHNGDSPSPLHRNPTPLFHNTVTLRKLKRLNSLILIFRVTAFIFSLASAVFMVTNSRASDSPHWFDFDAFRFVFAANAIVAFYSLFEMGVSVWEISAGATIFPEFLQVWFDFGHDQVFAYLSLSADSAGAALAKTLKSRDTCTMSYSFCVQSDISVALGFAGFLFLGLSSLLSGFRVVCYVINGSRFHI